MSLISKLVLLISPGPSTRLNVCSVSSGSMALICPMMVPIGWSSNTEDSEIDISEGGLFVVSSIMSIMEISSVF